MKKLLALILVLAAFMVALTVYVIPEQGGFDYATEERAGELGRADPAYTEVLPIQDIGLGVSGRSILIALVMLIHVLFANLHLGGSWIAVITESLGLRTGKARYERLARSLALFNVILFSAGATFAIAGIVFFVSLYPEFTKNLFHIYWWPLLSHVFCSPWDNHSRVRPFFARSHFPGDCPVPLGQ